MSFQSKPLVLGFALLTSACAAPSETTSSVMDVVPSRLDEQTNASLAEKMARLSSLTYVEDEREMRARLTGIFPNFSLDYVVVGDVKAVVVWDDFDVVVALRGTHPDDYSVLAANMGRNLSATRTDIPGAPSDARFHSGFADGANSVYPDVQLKLIAAGVRGKTLWLTGHSLGGAMAQIAAARMSSMPGYTMASVYTFGSPAPGNAAAQAHISNRLNVLRYFHPSDPVPRLPLGCFGYSRAPSEINVSTLGREANLPLFGTIGLPSGFSFSAHSIDSSYGAALRGAGLLLAEASPADDVDPFGEPETCDAPSDSSSTDMQ